MNERMLLSKLKHPFLINMYYAFQDRENLYLVMDYMRGGDLRYHIGRMRRFNEEQTSKHLAKSKLEFFVASIYIGLDYLHENKIIHRDIKPENLVLDDKGFVHITDLGIAREMKPENSQDTSGTPGYMGKDKFDQSPRGYVPPESYLCSGLLCVGGDRIRIHARKGIF